MSDYVYALHDFTPENPDEVPFKVGDRIEVIEKDDLYQDGWWQGRNPAGGVGLFPQSYTSPKPAPSTSTVSFPESSTSTSTAGETSSSSTTVLPTALQTLNEEPESSGSVNGANPVTDDRERTLSQGETMKATMTDVQKAIEQLGRNDRDGARSFSFASSHGDYTDRSEAETDGDTDADDEGGLGWHKGAREKLALMAQKENEERQARQAAETSVPNTPMRSAAPPIDVELSDESEGEEDDHVPIAQRHSDPYMRQYPHIPEEDEEEHEADEASQSPQPVEVLQERSAYAAPSIPDSASGHIVPSEDFVVPLPPDESDLPTATAEQTTFAAIVPPIPEPSLSMPAPAPAPSSAPTPTPMPTAQSTSIPFPSPEPQQPIPIVAPVPLKSTPSTIQVREPLPLTATPALPSPAASAKGSATDSLAGLQQTLTPATIITSFKTPAITPPPTLPQPEKQTSSGQESKKSMNPAEWNVEDVVEWLKSKGFDQGVCDKFIEQEITGDVLLDLDHNILKTEIEIAAFGKRARIVHAITELRRPPSLTESDHHIPPQHTSAPASRSHSITYSHTHTSSMQSSAQQSFNNSPLGYTGAQFSPAYSHSMMMTSPSAPPLSAGLGSMSNESSTLTSTGEMPSPGGLRMGWRASDPGSIHLSAVNESEPSIVGLGLGLPSSHPSTPVTNGKASKNRPSQLILSPSDGALKASTIAENQPTSATEDRAVLSDSETTTHTQDAKSRRRRLFGRSAESSSLKERASSLKDSSSRHSRDVSTPISASPSDVKGEFGDEVTPMRRHSKKRSTDDRKTSDNRLSLFGSPFSGTLGKSRKPPPRLSTGALDKPEKADSDKMSTLSTFSRIRHHAERKPSGRRPSTSDGTSRSKEKEKARDSPPIKDHKDPSLLRKRTTSTAEVPMRPAAALQAAGGPTLKPGKSILEQIGTPDHNGWMRKKGDRYNAWKLRYFVLKGPHLYCLKSNSPSETKIKGYINIIGYKVVADENVDPGRYGFKITHETDKPHYFSSDEHVIIREWMKALMKATITRDFSNPVVSSSNIPTIPLTVAQAMNPAPRPPSPSAREATQRAHRRENPNQLSTRDAQVLLMSMPSKDSKSMSSERARLESFFTNDSVSINGQDSTPMKKSATAPPKISTPPRPSRETRRYSSQNDYQGPVDAGLIEWANSHLPQSLQITDPMGPLCGGLALLRLAEDIKGQPSSPPVPDSAFPSGPNDDRIDGLFRLFDFLLDNDVKMGTVSINDIRQGKKDKVLQLLRAMKAWEDKRRAIAQSIGKNSITAGPFIALAGPIDYF